MSAVGEEEIMMIGYMVPIAEAELPRYNADWKQLLTSFARLQFCL
jgi:hypothetical protein